MRRNLTLTIAIGFVLLAASCGGGGEEGSSLGPVPTSEPTGNASPTSAAVSGARLPPSTRVRPR